MTNTDAPRRGINLFRVYRCRLEGRHLKRRDGSRSESRVSQEVWIAIQLDDRWEPLAEVPGEVVYAAGDWPASSKTEAIRAATDAAKRPKRCGGIDRRPPAASDRGA